jgi:hypothetical protein
MPALANNAGWSSPATAKEYAYRVSLRSGTGIVACKEFECSENSLNSTPTLSGEMADYGRHTGELLRDNGQGGIRTHDTLAGIPVFETDAFSHSATCPTAGKIKRKE